eukprot:6692098-Ditylum_brightwellii.AAC.1
MTAAPQSTHPSPNDGNHKDENNGSITEKNDEQDMNTTNSDNTDLTTLLSSISSKIMGRASTATVSENADVSQADIDKLAMFVDMEAHQK